MPDTTSGYQDWVGYADQAQYVGVDDAVALSAISNAADAVVTFAGRLLRRDGVIVPWEYALQLGAAYTLVTAYMQLAQGFIVGLEAASSTGEANDNWTYVKADLTRGIAGLNPTFQPITCGYVDVNFNFGYPRDRSQRPTDGAGLVYSPTISAPNAGSDVAYSTPNNARQLVTSIYLVLTTSSHAATRTITITINVGGSVVYKLNAPATVTASETARITLGQGLTYGGSVAAGMYMPLPEGLILPADSGFTTSTANIDTADQWGPCVIGVTEWASME